MREPCARASRPSTPTRSCTARSSTTSRIWRTNRRAAWDGYVGATRNVVDAAGDAQVVLISTDWVFDGTQAGATEDEPPNPINVYGFLKAASRAGGHRAREARRGRAHLRRAGRGARSTRAGPRLRVLCRLAGAGAARRRAVHRLGGRGHQHARDADAGQRRRRADLADAGARAHRHPPLLRRRVRHARGARAGDGARVRPRRRAAALRPAASARRRRSRTTRASTARATAAALGVELPGVADQLARLREQLRREAGRRRPRGHLRPRGRDGLPLAAPSRRGAARPARRPRGLREDRQDDGHPVPAPVGQPARRVELRRARQATSTCTASRCASTPGPACRCTARCPRPWTRARRPGVAELDGASDAFPFAHTVRLRGDARRRAADHDHDRGPRRPGAGQLRLPPVPADPGRPARRVARRAARDAPPEAHRPAAPERRDRAGRALHRPARRPRLRRRLRPARRRARSSSRAATAGSRCASRRASPSPRSTPRRPTT